MSKKSFDPKECITSLNTFKSLMILRDTPIDKNTFLDTFKSSGLPTHPNFWKMFRESGLIVKVAKGVYRFADDKPIYVGALSTIQRRYLELNRKYGKKEEDPKIYNAIKLLKDNGYIVLLPVKDKEVQIF